jgi:hypothetical protein
MNIYHIHFLFTAAYPHVALRAVILLFGPRGLTSIRAAWNGCMDLYRSIRYGRTLTSVLRVNVNANLGLGSKSLTNVTMEILLYQYRIADPSDWIRSVRERINR